MMRHGRLTLLALAALAQLGVSISMIWRAEQVIHNGTPMKFRIQLYDPYDPLQGRYVALRFEDTDLPEYPGPCDTYQTDTRYVILATNDAGFAHPVALADEAPAEGPYLRCPVHIEPQYRYDENNEAPAQPLPCRAWVSYPFNRFYVQEQKAPLIETALSELRGLDEDAAKGRAWVTVRIHKGMGILESLYIDGEEATQHAERILRESTPQ
jgi:uncharacterized membrane-anchored protein